MKTVMGTLKGYDQLMNLVLDDVKETLRGKSHLEEAASPHFFSLSSDPDHQLTILPRR